MVEKFPYARRRTSSMPVSYAGLLAETLGGLCYFILDTRPAFVCFRSGVLVSLLFSPVPLVFFSRESTTWLAIPFLVFLS